MKLLNIKNAVKHVYCLLLDNFREPLASPFF